MLGVLFGPNEVLVIVIVAVVVVYFVMRHKRFKK
jgi:hypothetical protein